MTSGGDVGASGGWFHFLVLLIKDQACNTSFAQMQTEV